MTRDYRGSAKQRPSRPGRSGGGTLLGIFIGLILGLGIAAGVFYYISRSPSPFQAAGEAGRGQIPRADGATAPSPAKSDKPRFDFYKILPGTDDAKTNTGERKSGETRISESKPTDVSKAAELKPPKSAEGRAPEQVYLQVASFANANDAENEKARLALLGFEAVIQTVTLADKGQRHRVRVGPYASVEEMNRYKVELAKRGVDATVIRNP